MALDGCVIKNIVSDMQVLVGARISKVAQPEKDELMLTFVMSNIAGEDPRRVLSLDDSHTRRSQLKLLISANASLPLIYFTEKNKPNPMTAPSFCMLLRKHIGGGRILSVASPGLERVIKIEVEHLDEMGDLCRHFLIVEIMGKYSNIILTDADGKIVDSIKRVSAQLSSVREVLPGREYFIPGAGEKLDVLGLADVDTARGSQPDGQADGQHDLGTAIGALTCTQTVAGLLTASDLPASKALYTNLTGISPIMAEELCYRAGVDSDVPFNAQAGPDSSAETSETSSARVDENPNLNPAISRIICELSNLATAIKEHDFNPCIIYRGDEPVEFSAFALSIYGDDKACELRSCESASEMLETYYASKAVISRIRQKSADLRKIVDTALSREAKKLDLQQRQQKDTEKRDKLRIYGELLRAYAYTLEDGASEAIVEDYNNENKEVKIPLDSTLSIQENATKYYDRYQKLRRTAEALEALVDETQEAVDQLREIRMSLDNAQTEGDLAEIRQELFESGYVKKGTGKSGGAGFAKGAGKQKNSGKPGASKSGALAKSTSEPLHFTSKDGFDIYVGKNNIQNEYVTFSLAGPDDWWFHAKNRPGSHVIIKSGGAELPDRVFEEAAALAAKYSSASVGEKVEIDYTKRRNLKKPAGGRLGLVIYHTNYSLIIENQTVK